MTGCPETDNTTRRPSAQPASRPGRDQGSTFVEILIALVLLSLVVVASIATLQTTIKSSRIDRDHANAFAWLQAASDAVYRSPHVSCADATLPNPDPGRVRSAYHAVVTDTNQVSKPVVWASNPAATIAVTNVEFLWRASYDASYVWSAAGCLEAEDQYTQRVTIEVTTPDGAKNTLQMVKGK